MRLILILARKRRLDLVTVRAVAERRLPERCGVKERRAAFRLEVLLACPGKLFWGEKNRQCSEL